MSIKELSREEAHKLRDEYAEKHFLWKTSYEKQRDHHVKQFIEFLYSEASCTILTKNNRQK
jgi:hypothetical protein